MEELSYLLRLQNYYTRKRRHVKDRLEKLSISYDLQQRLLQGRESLQRSLADCIRTENKDGFCSIYGAYQDSQFFFSLLRMEQHPTDQHDPDGPQRALPTENSFLKELSGTSRTAITDFLSRIVGDPVSLSDTIAGLPRASLESLISSTRKTHEGPALFGQQRFTATKKSRSSLNSRISRDTTFDSGHYQYAFSNDTLTVLLGLVGCHITGDTRIFTEERLKPWAVVTARLLREKKPGNENFVVELVHTLASQSEMVGKRALETWLMEILLDGQFILEKPENQAFRIGEPATQDQDYSLRLEAIMNVAVRKLMSLLKNNDRHGIIPQHVLSFARLVITELEDSPQLRDSFSRLIVSRWLFTSFLLDRIITPESHGMLLGQYFPETARHRILRDVALRAQKIAFDVAYPWKNARPTDADSVTDVKAIAELFALESKTASLRRGHTVSTPGSFPSRVPGPCVICVCPSDIISLIEGLLPENVEKGDKVAAPPSLRSSPSSVFGTSQTRGLPTSSRNHSTQATGSSPAEPSSNLSRPFAQLNIGRTFSTLDNSTDPTKSRDSGHTLVGRAIRQAYLEIQRTVSNSHASSSGRNSCTVLETTAEGLVRIQGSQDMKSVSNDPEDHDGESESDETDDDVHHLADYRGIKRVIGKLLSDPELFPRMPFVSSNGSTPGLESSYHPGDMKPRNPFDEVDPARMTLGQNPFRRRADSSSAALNSVVDDTDSSGLPITTGSPVRLPSSLSDCLEHAIEHYERNEEYASALSVSRTLDRIKQLSPALTRQGCKGLLNHLIQDVRSKLVRIIGPVKLLEVRISQTELKLRDQDHAMAAISRTIKALRLKMWYCMDIRSCGPYDELSKVARALHIMNTVTRLSLGKSSLQLRHSSGPRSRIQNMQLKTDLAVLEIITAPKDVGGPNKLSGEQATAILNWMQNAGIENVCKGEERLHRLYLEISRCIEQLVGVDPLTSPVLWGSALFQSDRQERDRDSPRFEFAPMANQRSSPGIPYRPGSVGSDNTFGGYPDRGLVSSGRQSQASRTSWAQGGQGSLEAYGTRSPPLTHKSSTVFWSPSGDGSETPSSFSSFPSSLLTPKGNLHQSASRDSIQSSSGITTFLTELRQGLTSLLLSDMSMTDFSAGSETDLAIWKSFNGVFGKQLALHFEAHQKSQEKPLDDRISLGAIERATAKQNTEVKEGEAQPDENTTQQRESAQRQTTSRRARLDYQSASRKLVRRFDLEPSPYTKILALYQLEVLVLAAVENQSVKADNVRTSKIDTFFADKADYGEVGLDSADVAPQRTLWSDTSVRAFQRLFRDETTRPPRLYRDLQGIASLVPADVLDSTKQGKAFWNATVAALSLKQQICRLMIETADQIIAHHTTTRGHSRSASAAQTERDAASFSTHKSGSLAQQDVSHFSMADAAQIFQIAAKEGDAVAQRELATLYLTHPELMERIIAPLSKPKDVFKHVADGKWKKDEDPSRFDPLTMCVAHHWMELSSRGGDVLATRYLQTKAEMERIP